MMIVRHSYISVQTKRKAFGVSLKAARGLAIGTALAHIKYIQHRPGRDLEKGGREVFSSLDDEADIAEFRKMIREYDGNGAVVHKITLSPEVSPEDPKAYTREVMHNLGSDKGRDLNWIAVSHGNTDHPHIHVVVFGRDEHGQTVRLSKRDYDRMKETGDRFIERNHTFEFREAERRRQERQRDRSEERSKQLERERQERIRNGEELPWLHKKIVREQLEPYEKWKQEHDKDLVREPNDKNRNHDKAPHTTPDNDKTKESFQHNGKRYSKDDSYEELSGLLRNVRQAKDKEQRLPKESYQKLTNWVEAKDRQKFAGEPAKQLEIAKRQHAQFEKNRNSPSANRYVSPLQQELMKNPIMGLFLTEAAIAAELVRMIPLTDQRDRLKENREELESAKRDREQQQRKRSRVEDKERDEEAITNMEQAIDENKRTREDIRKEKEKSKEKRDRDLDFTR